MRQRGRIDPVLARRLMGVITTGIYGAPIVVAWLKLCGASGVSDRGEKAA